MTSLTTSATLVAPPFQFLIDVFKLARFTLRTVVHPGTLLAIKAWSPSRLTWHRIVDQRRRRHLIDCCQDVWPIGQGGCFYPLAQGLKRRFQVHVVDVTLIRTMRIVLKGSIDFVFQVNKVPVLQQLVHFDRLIQRQGVAARQTVARLGDTEGGARLCTRKFVQLGDDQVYGLVANATHQANNFGTNMLVVRQPFRRACNLLTSFNRIKLYKLRF